MNLTAQQFLTMDLPALLAAVLATVACALLGNFLVLRRLSLMGDAISHAVLPGIVLAFLLTGSRATLPVVIGAAAAGVATAALIEMVCRLGRVETSAAMGVVFSILFALGVVLLEQAAADRVDLDADCVLYGQLEDIFWPEATGWGSLISRSALAAAPREIITLAIVTALVAAFIALFFKELRITSFDPQLATTLGFRSGLMHYALMLLVAIAAVAAFEAVGSILVIAMLICPAAAARMVTDRLAPQIWASVGFALAAAIFGYTLAAWAPPLLGAEHSLIASGMITVVAGALLAGAILFSPSHGVAARISRRHRLSATIAREDLLALLYRREEAGLSAISIPDAVTAIVAGAAGLTTRTARRAIRAALRRGEAAAEPHNTIALSTTGRDEARRLIRAHRLWESWLVDEAGLRPDHVHRSAMDLEHVTSRPMRTALGRGEAPARDPHQREIPVEPPPPPPSSPDSR